MKSKRQIYSEMLRWGLLAIRRRYNESVYCHIIADFLHEEMVKVSQEWRKAESVI